MKKPIVGVPLAYCNPSFNHSESALPQFSDFPFYALRVFEANAIYSSGGLPVYIPYVWEEIDAYLDLCQGLVFPGGGGDFHTSPPPSQTLQEYHLDSQACPDVVRTTFEIALLSRALERDIPILGICRGAQLINKVCGGDLGFVETLQKPGQEPLTHWYKTPKDLAHPLFIEPNSFLSKCVQSHDAPLTNSIHYEAISRLGANLKITAQTTDGIIEAIESTSHRWVVGVQWHPEFLLSPLDGALFSLFIEACASPRQLKAPKSF